MLTIVRNPFCIFAFANLVLLSSMQVAANYQDGYKDGKKAVDNLWANYKRNCDDIFVFSAEAVDKLIKGTYAKRRQLKKKKKDKKARKDKKKNGVKGGAGRGNGGDFNSGARQAVRDGIVEYQLTCVTPKVCDEIGQTASSIISADFCGEGGFSMAQFKKRTPAYTCRKAATLTCTAYMLSSVDSVLRRSNCAPIGGDISRLGFNALEDLQNKCNRQVDTMIEWSDL